MEIIRTIDWMKQRAREAQAAGRIVGLVPTMGALHEGHLSLVRAALQQCSPVIVSIFVNPKQFGPSEDLQKYPRTFETDSALLETLGVDYLFAPSVEEMYPRGFSTLVEVEGLSGRLEGRSRPGHFRGVTTVVAKLLGIVQPAIAFFGRKDAQQLRLIRQIVSDLNSDAHIIECPIVRERDGLALSSRNAYLHREDRSAATALYRALCAIRDEIAAGERAVAALLAAARRVLENDPRIQVDYAEIADAETFESVASVRARCYALLAARIGGTRLIDNALIEQEGDSFRVTI